MTALNKKRRAITKSQKKLLLVTFLKISFVLVFQNFYNFLKSEIFYCQSILAIHMDLSVYQPSCEPVNESTG